ncbi:hypothetical protein BDR26DRAFT_853832 [Obelidium mucronatum]|nr:hypothetical protein BDR26DRAFT_853832 [Obelidium mucronatum]
MPPKTRTSRRAPAAAVAATPQTTARKTNNSKCAALFGDAKAEKTKTRKRCLDSPVLPATPFSNVHTPAKASVNASPALNTPLLISQPEVWCCNTAFSYSMFLKHNSKFHLDAAPTTQMGGIQLLSATVTDVLFSPSKKKKVSQLTSDDNPNRRLFNSPASVSPAATSIEFLLQEWESCLEDDDNEADAVPSSASTPMPCTSSASSPSALETSALYAPKQLVPHFDATTLVNTIPIPGTNVQSKTASPRKKKSKAGLVAASKAPMSIQLPSSHHYSIYSSSFSNASSSGEQTPTLISSGSDFVDFLDRSSSNVSCKSTSSVSSSCFGGAAIGDGDGPVEQLHISLDSIYSASTIMSRCSPSKLGANAAALEGPPGKKRKLVVYKPSQKRTVAKEQKALVVACCCECEQGFPEHEEDVNQAEPAVDEQEESLDTDSDCNEERDRPTIIPECSAPKKQTRKRERTPLNTLQQLFGDDEHEQNESWKSKNGDILQTRNGKIAWFLCFFRQLQREFHQHPFTRSQRGCSPATSIVPLSSRRTSFADTISMGPSPIKPEAASLLLSFAKTASGTKGAKLQQQPPLDLGSGVDDFESLMLGSGQPCVHRRESISMSTEEDLMNYAMIMMMDTTSSGTGANDVTGAGNTSDGKVDDFSSGGNNGRWSDLLEFGSGDEGLAAACGIDAPVPLTNAASMDSMAGVGLDGFGDFAEMLGEWDVGNAATWHDLDTFLGIDTNLLLGNPSSSNSAMDDGSVIENITASSSTSSLMLDIASPVVSVATLATPRCVSLEPSGIASPLSVVTASPSKSIRGVGGSPLKPKRTYDCDVPDCGRKYSSSTGLKYHLGLHKKEALKKRDAK